MTKIIKTRKYLLVFLASTLFVTGCGNDDSASGDNTIDAIFDAICPSGLRPLGKRTFYLFGCKSEQLRIMAADTQGGFQDAQRFAYCPSLVHSSGFVVDGYKMNQNSEYYDSEFVNRLYHVGFERLC